MRSIINRQFLMSAGTIGVSLVAGTMSMSLVSGLIPTSTDPTKDLRSQMDKYLGLIHVLLGTLMYTMLRNRHLKTAGLVFGGLGVYDLIASNVPQIGLVPLPRSNINITRLLPATYREQKTISTAPAAQQGMSYSRGRSPVMVGSSYERNQRTVGLSGNPYSDIELE
jgi:hypothetical protein